MNPLVSSSHSLPYDGSNTNTNIPSKHSSYSTPDPSSNYNGNNTTTDSSTAAHQFMTSSVTKRKMSKAMQRQMELEGFETQQQLQQAQLAASSSSSSTSLRLPPHSPGILVNSGAFDASGNGHSNSIILQQTAETQMERRRNKVAFVIGPAGSAGASQAQVPEQFQVENNSAENDDTQGRLVSSASVSLNSPNNNLANNSGNYSLVMASPQSPTKGGPYSYDSSAKPQRRSLTASTSAADSHHYSNANNQQQMVGNTNSFQHTSPPLPAIVIDNSSEAEKISPSRKIDWDGASGGDATKMMQKSGSGGFQRNSSSEGEDTGNIKQQSPPPAVDEFDDYFNTAYLESRKKPKNKQRVLASEETRRISGVDDEELDPKDLDPNYEDPKPKRNYAASPYYSGLEDLIDANDADLKEEPIGYLSSSNAYYGEEEDPFGGELAGGALVSTEDADLVPSAIDPLPDLNNSRGGEDDPFADVADSTLPAAALAAILEQIPDAGMPTQGGADTSQRGEDVQDEAEEDGYVSPEEETSRRHVEEEDVEAVFLDPNAPKKRVFRQRDLSPLKLADGRLGYTRGSLSISDDRSLYEGTHKGKLLEASARPLSIKSFHHSPNYPTEDGGGHLELSISAQQAASLRGIGFGTLAAVTIADPFASLRSPGRNKLTTFSASTNQQFSSRSPNGAGSPLVSSNALAPISVKFSASTIASFGHLHELFLSEMIQRSALSKRIAAEYNGTFRQGLVAEQLERGRQMQLEEGERFVVCSEIAKQFETFMSEGTSKPSDEATPLNVHGKGPGSFAFATTTVALAERSVSYFEASGMFAPNSSANDQGMQIRSTSSGLGAVLVMSDTNSSTTDLKSRESTPRLAPTAAATVSSPTPLNQSRFETYIQKIEDKLALSTSKPVSAEKTVQQGATPNTSSNSEGHTEVAPTQQTTGVAEPTLLPVVLEEVDSPISQSPDQNPVDSVRRNGERTQFENSSTEALKAEAEARGRIARLEEALRQEWKSLKDRDADAISAKATKELYRTRSGNGTEKCKIEKEPKTDEAVAMPPQVNARTVTVIQSRRKIGSVPKASASPKAVGHVPPQTLRSPILKSASSNTVPAVPALQLTPPPTDESKKELPSGHPGPFSLPQMVCHRSDEQATSDTISDKPANIPRHSSPSASLKPLVATDNIISEIDTMNTTNTSSIPAPILVSKMSAVAVATPSSPPSVVSFAPRPPRAPQPASPKGYKNSHSAAESGSSLASLPLMVMSGSLASPLSPMIMLQTPTSKTTETSPVELVTVERKLEPDNVLVEKPVIASPPAIPNPRAQRPTTAPFSIGSHFITTSPTMAFSASLTTTPQRSLVTHLQQPATHRMLFQHRHRTGGKVASSAHPGVALPLTQTPNPPTGSGALHSPQKAVAPGFASPTDFTTIGSPASPSSSVGGKIRASAFSAPIKSGISETAPIEDDTVTLPLLGEIGSPSGLRGAIVESNRESLATVAAQRLATFDHTRRFCNTNHPRGRAHQQTSAAKALMSPSLLPTVEAPNHPAANASTQRSMPQADGVDIQRLSSPNRPRQTAQSAQGLPTLPNGQAALRQKSDA